MSIPAHLCPWGWKSQDLSVLILTFPSFLPIPDFTMWATCCNWFCLDGQPEEVPPPQGAMAQAYSNPGYSSFPSPTGLEPSCKACGAHFASTSRKVSLPSQPALPSASALRPPCWPHCECLPPGLSLGSTGHSGLCLSQKSCE